MKQLRRPATRPVFVTSRRTCVYQENANTSESAAGDTSTIRRPNIPAHPPKIVTAITAGNTPSTQPPSRHPVVAARVVHPFMGIALAPSGFRAERTRRPTPKPTLPATATNRAHQGEGFVPPNRPPLGTGAHPLPTPAPIGSAVRSEWPRPFAETGSHQACSGGIPPPEKSEEIHRHLGYSAGRAGRSRSATRRLPSSGDRGFESFGSGGRAAPTSSGGDHRTVIGTR